VHLDEYLSADDPFLEPIFASPKNARIALLRPQVANLLKWHDPGLLTPESKQVAHSV
jgi:hypothetical protein